MTALFIFLSLFVSGSFVGFLIVKEMQVEKLFKANKAFQIKVFYFIFSVITGLAFGLVFYIIYSLSKPLINW